MLKDSVVRTTAGTQMGTGNYCEVTKKKSSKRILAVSLPGIHRRIRQAENWDWLVIGRLCVSWCHVTSVNILVVSASRLDRRRKWRRVVHLYFQSILETISLVLAFKCIRLICICQFLFRLNKTELMCNLFWAFEKLVFRVESLWREWGSTSLDLNELRLKKKVKKLISRSRFFCVFLTD